MSESRRGDSKEIRKDQLVRREVREEIVAEVSGEQTSTPRYCNPNRDQARGDRDRSSRRTDENSSRDES